MYILKYHLQRSKAFKIIIYFLCLLTFSLFVCLHSGLKENEHFSCMKNKNEISNILLRNNANNVINKHRHNSVIYLNICSHGNSHCKYECLNNKGVIGRVSEDQLNVSDAEQLPSLPFLKEFRSPCFEMTGQSSQLNNSDSKIRCLPYFFLAGFPKTGTTDLYSSMRIHKEIKDPFSKEPHWWSNPKRPSFLGYLDQFQVKATSINNTHFNGNLFGDFSTREFLDENPNGKWTLQTSTLFNLKRTLPCARFIVMLRDPVERLYSDYIYFSGRQYKRLNETDMTKITPRDFHRKCIIAIHWWKVCLLNNHDDARICLHRTSTKGMPDLSKSHNKCWSNNNYTCKAFRNGFYYYYISDWLDIFPVSQFIFIRLEDYARNKVGTINSILTFLGVRSFDYQEIKSLRRLALQVPGGAKLRSQYPPMMTQTRIMLTEFYRESNVKLAKLLGDKHILHMWQT